MIKSVVNYLKEVKAEASKVNWPGRDQVVNNTYVVIISSIVMGAVIASMDWALSAGLKFLIK